ncbi:peptide deformylase, partial [Candidatus Woesearchaeota archaeon]|nr:peptide deformylase [Candidatus Woesearchaeota archaeon]
FQHEIDHLDGILATDYLENNKNIILREEWEKLFVPSHNQKSLF